jgi:hypothetical protein
MAAKTKVILTTGALLLGVSNLSPALAAKASKTKTVKRVRVQQTTKVEYTVSYRFDKEATEGDPDVLHQRETTQFMAERSELMDTYIDSRTKRREYIAIQANGLRTDRTVGSVTSSGSFDADLKDSIASTSHNVSSSSPKLLVSIPTIRGDATREIGLELEATMAGERNVDFRLKDPEAQAAVAGLPKGQSVITAEWAGVRQQDPNFDRFIFSSKAELFGKLSPTEQPIAFQLSQTAADRMWLGLEADERAGHYLALRYDRTISRFPGLSERLKVSIDFGSPTFRPYKG